MKDRNGEQGEKEERVPGLKRSKKEMENKEREM